MGRLIKFLIVAAFVGGLLYAGSYAGARATSGKYLGSPLPEMGVRTSELAVMGIPELPTHPRAWVLTYSRVSVNGNKPAKLFISLDGKLLGSVPKDLDKRLDAWRRSREIQ